MFRFGTIQIETENPKETAMYDDFIDRLYKCGFTELTGYNKQNYPLYKLTIAAYNKFS